MSKLSVSKHQDFMVFLHGRMGLTSADKGGGGAFFVILCKHSLWLDFKLNVHVRTNNLTECFLAKPNIICKVMAYV